MKTKQYGIFAVLTMVVLLVSVTATALIAIPANDQAKLVSQGPAHSPVINDDWTLTRVDFIHYAQSAAPASKPIKTETCYKLLGGKWKTLPVNYIINPGNPQNLSPTFVTSAISTAAETWDAATGSELFNNAYSVDYNIKYGIQDYKNAIQFGDYSDGNAIAVTSVWFNRKGIVEFDILFNTKYTWGNATVNPIAMDLQNIATHELGHGIGLNDIYTASCSAVTMYGYSSYGDIAKRTLEQPDITGLKSMYG